MNKIISTLKKLVKPGPSNRNSLNRGVPKNSRMKTVNRFPQKNTEVPTPHEKNAATRSILWTAYGETRVLEVAA